MANTWQTVRRWWIAIGASAVCIGMMITANADSTGRGGYVVSNVTLSETPKGGTHPADEAAVVTFDLAWEASSYPGTRNCIWTVYDTQDSPIGTKSVTISGMERSYSGLTEEIPLDGEGEPTSAEARCDGVRIDDGNAQLRVSDVSFEPVDSRNIEVHFTVSTTGGVPPPSACDLEVYGRSGQLLLSHDLNVFTDRLDTVPIDKVVGQREGWRDSPDRVEVNCVPF